MSHFLKSLQHKKELLYSVASLAKMGYKLYGSFGTADFYSSHGIQVWLRLPLVPFEGVKKFC